MKTDSAVQDELLPCPFCDGVAWLGSYLDGEDETHWQAGCSSCGAVNGEEMAESTPDREFAIASWNRRTHHERDGHGRMGRES